MSVQVVMVTPAAAWTAAPCGVALMVVPVGGPKFSLNNYGVRVALTFASVWYAHAEYWPKDGDPIPRVFGRHPSAHGVSRLQYSRINAVHGLMLVTSVLKFFDVELRR